MGNAYYYWFIALLLALSAFFSGSETALFSLSRVYLKKLEKSDSKRGKMVIKLLERPRRLLITLLLGNTMVNMAISSFSTLLVYKLAANYGWNLPLAITLQIIIATAIVLLFGEIMPKLIALSKANELCLSLVYPVAVVQIILFPAVWVFEMISLMASSKQSQDRHVGQRFTNEEFHNLIQSESSSGTLEENEKRMLVGLARFREATIREIYVPRVRMTAIAENQSLEELRDLIMGSGYSRIPVYRGSIDDIVGIIYVKDLLLYPEKGSIKELMRPAWFVTEKMKIQSLLNQFKARKMQLAVVVDEYGGTSGIISLEDILEEIVGEIRDEYDRDEIPELSHCEDGSSIISGEYSVRLFNSEFDADISVEEYDNMAEFLLAEFNHVPAVDESYIYEGRLRLTILESDEKSIKRIKVHILGES
ncbi:MAG: hemolysin family protein [Candidatus Cloacimonadaceae bacterium]